MRTLITILLLMSFLSGCGYLVTKDEFAVLQKQTYQLEKEFRATSTSLSSEAGELKSTTTRLDELHENLRKSFADTNVRIDELDFSLSKLKGEYENFKLETRENFKNIETLFKIQNEFIQKMNSQILNLSTGVEELKKDTVTFKNITSEINVLKEKIREIETKQNEMAKHQITKGETKTKQQLYDESLELYNKGNYENAINAFEQFVILYPQDSLTDNALYWIGESYYALKKFNDALLYFHRIVVDFPNADKVPSALYKESLTLENLGMLKEAEGALKELMVRFPISQEAQEARKKIKKK